MATLICFFAGPNTGKSTYAAKLYSFLAEKSIDVEFIQEGVKRLTYNLSLEEDIEDMNKQDLVILQSALSQHECVIYDRSPLVSAVYGKRTKAEVRGDYSYLKGHDIVHLCPFGDLAYREGGRFQTQSEAEVLTSKFLDIRKKYQSEFRFLDTYIHSQDISVLANYIFPSIVVEGIKE